MSRLQAFIVCVVFFANLFVLCVERGYSQDGNDAVALPRVGASIDAYERAYFGLFPDDTRFREARVRSTGSNTFELIVSQDSSERDQRSIAITGREWQLLSHYLIAYENEISWPEYLPLVQKGILRQHVTQPHPEEEVTVVMKGGMSLNARLLSLIDGTLCLTTSGDRNSISGRDTLMQSIPLRSIVVILHTYSRGALRNAILGFLAGYAVAFLLMRTTDEYASGSEFGVFRLSFEAALLAPAVPAAALAAIAGTSMSTRTDSICVSACGDERTDAISRIRSLCAFPYYPPPEILRSVQERDAAARDLIEIIRSYREAKGESRHEDHAP